jgi:hypothetical protein
MITYLATALLAVMSVTAPAQPLHWEADYGKALKATRADDLPLLVVLDKPQTEDARLDPALLTEGSPAGEENQELHAYQLCHVDVTTDYGQKVAKAFHAEAFPYTAIIDKTGSVIIFSQTGKIGASQWKDVLSTHKDGNRPSLATISHVSYKMSDDSATIQRPSTSISNGSYCPSCQRHMYGY